MEVRFILDIGSNHNRSLSRCEKLIKEAKRVGAWGIKVQLFDADKLYHHTCPNQIEQTKQRELPILFLPVLKEMCKVMNIKFGITPFDIGNVGIACTYVDFLKISSYDILRLDLIEACSTKPLFISTGGANRKEIWDINNLFWNRPNYSPTLLHCVSEYPTHPEEVNMYKLDFLKTFGNPVGWSDHTVQEGVIYQAVTKGARTIELHFDLEDKEGNESHLGHCWLPNNVSRVIYNIKIAMIAEGGLGGEGIDKNKISEMRSQRADPSDGLRPMKDKRKD